MKTIIPLLFLLFPAAVFSAPAIENGGFEEQVFRGDRGYEVNNKPIVAWQTGGNVGLNPWYYGGHEERREFANNGLIPEGNQVLFIQFEGSISQMVDGFEKGKSYRVVFFANARVTPHVPTLTVKVGEHLLLKEVTIPPVEAVNSFQIPYARMETPAFVSDKDGEMEVVFKTGAIQDTAVLLDGIAIEEVRDGASK